MAHYTTQLRSIIEQINHDHISDDQFPSFDDPVLQTDALIENARPYIFSFYYPINQNDKQRFEHNFLRHFYTREIGFETYGLWKLKLADEINMIIPKYNKLWEDATKYINTDLLANTDYNVIRNYTGTKNSNETNNFNGTNVSNGSNVDVMNRDTVRAYSDTPQGNMDNLLNENYLTNLTHEYDNGSSIRRTNNNTTNTNNTTNSNGNVNDSHNEIVRYVGKNGGMSYAEAILKARETYLNIDLMLCNDMRDLFMLIW